MTGHPPSPILGIHHVTATVGKAQPDLDFFVGVLGLPLVKRTVNFDNPRVYHFYYGDALGAPGTLMTTFPYAGEGVREGVRGAGQVLFTRFSAPPGSLSTWRNRLEASGAPVQATRVGEAAALETRDPSGLGLVLVEAPEEGRTPAADGKGRGLPPALALRGIHSVELVVRELAPSLAFAIRHLGLEIVDRNEAWARLGAPGAGDAPGRFLDLRRASPELPDGVNGLGTVHHVALAVADEALQVRLRERLLSEGVKVTGVKDRKYFRSIYFREPGGVLYEVATRGPGFSVDENPAALGEVLRLPPGLDGERESIARHLESVNPPRPGERSP